MSQHKLLEVSKKDMPVICLDVFKEGDRIESVTLQGKNNYILGRHPQCDVPLLHESISRQHACVVVDEVQGCVLIDLGSTTGTNLDGNSLDEHVG